MSVSFKGITYITSSNPVKTDQFAQSLIVANSQKCPWNPPAMYSLNVPGGHAVFTGKDAKLVSDMSQSRAILCNYNPMVVNSFTANLLGTLFEQEKAKGKVNTVNLDLLA